MKSVSIFRQKHIARLRTQLIRYGAPRWHMLWMVVLTGGVGFLTSALLLHAGLDVMWQRYALAFVVAYVAFLGFLWLWLNRAGSDASGDWSNWPDVSKPSPNPDVSGGGGEAAGGGASGDFSDDGGLNDALGTVAEGVGSAEEMAIPLALLLAVGAVCCASLYVVYSAPILLAELLVDAFLMARLYRGLRHIPTHLWLKSAIKRTWWPFALTGFSVVLGAWWMR